MLKRYQRCVSEYLEVLEPLISSGLAMFTLKNSQISNRTLIFIRETLVQSLTCAEWYGVSHLSWKETDDEFLFRNLQSLFQDDHGSIRSIMLTKEELSNLKP